MLGCPDVRSLRCRSVAPVQESGVELGPWVSPLLASSAVLLLSGCALWWGGEGDPPPFDLWVEQSPEGEGVVDVHVSEAAQVAVFEIVTNRGVSLLHPSPAAPGARLEAGSHGLSVDRPFLRLQRARFSEPTTTIGNHPAPAERYLFAVASTDSLALAPLLERGASLRELLGVRAYAPSDSNRAAWAVVDLVVEDPGEQDHWMAYQHPDPEIFFPPPRR